MINYLVEKVKTTEVSVGLGGSLSFTETDVVDVGECEPVSVAALVLVHYPADEGYAVTFPEDTY